MLRRAINILVFTLLCLAGTLKAPALQENQARDSSSSIWLTYFGEHPISPHWNLHLEGEVFSYGPVESRELIFVRPGFRRVLSRGASVLVTYGYFLKYPSITNTSRTLDEHRISEDLQWRHPVPGKEIDRLAFTHRLRTEQRFEAQEEQKGHGDIWEYAERFRYRLAANVPLPGNTVGRRPDYLSIYNEVFVNFGPHSNRTLDQNIAAGAVGWNLSPALQVEAGYLLEYFPSTVGLVGRYNHAMQINLNSTIPFSKAKRSQ